MRELQADVDVEAMTQDLSSEPLPEPLLIILSPPPPFLPVPGEPSTLWPKWLEAFEHYIVALGENELTDSSKCALLQNCLGCEGQRVFASLVQTGASYAAAVSALSAFFSSDFTSQMARLKFHQRAQFPGETVEEFVCALRELLRPCRYGDSEHKLILDQLIEKTNVPPLRDRLLLEKESLTLDEALAIGKEVESNLNECDIHEVVVDIGGDSELPVRRKRGRPRHDEQRAKEDTKPQKTRCSAASTGSDRGEDKRTRSGDDEEPPVKRRRGRPRRDERQAKDQTEATAARAAAAPRSYKDDFYFDNDRRYYSDHGEDRSRDDDDDDGGWSSSKRKEDEADEDFVAHPTERPPRRRRGRPRLSEQRAKVNTRPHPTKTVRSGGCGADTAEVSDEDCRVNHDGEGESGSWTHLSSDKTSSSSPSPSTETTGTDCGHDGADCGHDGADCGHDGTDCGHDGADYGHDGADSTEPPGPCCPVCVDRRFRDGYRLSRHMRTHTQEKPFSCPDCTGTFSQSYHMMRHMRNQHGAGLHTCSTCGKTLGSSAELRSHKRTHVAPHGSVQVVAPSSHQTGGVTHPDLDTRVSECRDSQPEDKKDVQAEAQDGGTGKVPSEKKPKGHFCPICVDRCFKGANKLARHMRTHTKEKPFSCPDCGASFSQSYHMTRHLRIQHNSGKYICSKCGKSLSSFLELRAHRKSHAVDGLTCLACDRQFTQKAALLSHLKLHKKVQASPRSLVCGDCGKAFGRLYHLKRHMATHRKASGGDSYRCPDCHKVFAFPEDLNKHLETHVSENNGTCPKCGETFGGPEELETHLKVHEKSYSCGICGKKFKVEYALKKHEQRHRSRQDFCSLCQKFFSKLSHYKRHLKVHERRENRCPHCHSVFLNLTAFKYHLQTHTAERPHQCSCCVETFQTKEELERHRLKHKKFKGERPFTCTRCDAAFAALSELTEHLTSHEGEQPLNCSFCGRTFLNKNKLQKHLSLHTGERPHLCPVCGSGFPSTTRLRLHIDIHTAEKPHRCPHCSKSFKFRSGLRGHSRQHMEQRPSYQCPECGRSYGRLTELKMHQRNHTGDKPYACTCCSKRFINKHKLNVHMRIHTGERPYSCPHCKQTFTQTGDRNRHISKCHQ